MQALGTFAGEVMRSWKREKRSNRAAQDTRGICEVTLDKTQWQRLTILRTMTQPWPQAERALRAIPAADWNRHLPWLDTSGTALYFADRLLEIGCIDVLPAKVMQRMKQNLSDNAERMNDLAEESCALHRGFQERGTRYATLKGFSLYPISVPKLELRSQLDLDFLVAERDATEAKDVLESRGYHLRAISGRSMEFKSNEDAAMSLRDLYKPRTYRSVELHLEYTGSRDPLLPFLHLQPFRDTMMPVLRPEDLFLGQGVHVFKHVCSEFFRVSHLLEFRTHVLHRHDDAAFWQRLRLHAKEDVRTHLGIGLVVDVITQVMGEFAPRDLTDWTSAMLPEGATRWSREFAHQVVLGSFPGNKLYLLLQEELAASGVPHRRTVKQSLIPVRMPPPVMNAKEGESVRQRLRRRRAQASFVALRARFHLIEGLRYAWHARRWKRMKEIALLASVLLFLPIALQAGQSSLPSANSETAGRSQDDRAVTQRSSAPAGGSGETVAAAPRMAPGSSAAQIQTLLRANPDALMEVKQFVSDTAAESGQAVASDNMTDEALYSLIASNAAVRGNVAAFLRTRGYLTDSEVSAEDLPLPEEGYSASTMRPSARGEARPTPLDPLAAKESPEPKVLRRATPYNLLSLHDLYTQVTDDTGSLKRFGSDVFLRRDTASRRALAPAASLDVPADSSYMLGPGDSVVVQIWGGVSQTLPRTVDREGFLALPEAGRIQVAGLSLERAQAAVSEALKQQYRNAQVALSLARLRTVHVYVVGDVQRPGSYEISTLATPLSALYLAGGPTAVGSLRLLRHYRGSKLLGEIDLYDFLLNGVQSEDRLQAGDTLLVPPTGPQVSVSGAVKRPAIYELKGQTRLAALIEMAGGATVTAELSHIVIDRVRANQERETVDLALPVSSAPAQARAAIETMTVQDGDHVRVSPIMSYSQRVVYADGHVLRPGRMAYRDGMRLSDVLPSYRELLPEPAERGEIIRLVPPDFHVETIDFSVPDLMVGNNNVLLQPFDTIRILGRYEADAPKVTINGEVLRPGTYPLSQEMTAAQLVRMAGGFKRDALLTFADLTSYSIVNGTRIQGERSAIAIGNAVRNVGSSDVALKAGDTLTVHKLTGWDDIGSSISLEGEVSHPGSYGFQQGERLSSVLRRAGGFRDTAYPDGAVLIRTEVQRLEEKSRDELIRQIETSSSAARITPTIAAVDQATQLQVVQAQQDQILSHLKSQPAVGRMVIHVGAEIASWENTPADIEVRAGDTLRVPKRPGFVLVSGQVYNSSAITFAPGKPASWYLHRAGGPTEVANTRQIFVIRANGTVVGHENGTVFRHDVLGTKLEPGDVVVVPQKIIGASLFWRNLLTVAQITSSIAITAAVAGVL
ncbi:SLBB domain-containing protein [Terriglobus roseus]|nr:SLBB domain-containing protein [Terriglobus roseus]